MLNLKRTLLSSAITLALSQGVMTQAATVTGVVEDSFGILPGAKVEVVDQNISATADSKGQFTLKGIEKGAYQLKITYMGYQDTIIPITVENEKSALGALLLNNSENLEEVEIVGSMVRGEMRALNMKKNASNIKDVISQDGIGKLPDRNAAEAVQRVPGVSIERDQGEGRFVAVRGLPSQWNSATINGNRIPAAEEETTTRATAFDFFPTDLIEIVEVNKALTADMEGDAIGGNVNFITKTAPAEQTLKLGVGTNYNAKADDWGYNWSALYGDRVMDGKLGYIVNLTGWNRKWATDNFETRRDDYGIKRLELRDYIGERDTYGANTGFEYNLDNGDQVYGRAMYGTLSDTEIHYKHRYRFDKYSPEKGGRIEIQHIYNELITEMFGGDIGGKHNIGDKSELKWNLAHYQNRFFYGDIPNGDDKAYFVAKFKQNGVQFEGLEETEKGYRANNIIDGGTDSHKAISTHVPDGFTYDPSSMPIADFNLYKVDITEKDNIVASLDFSHELTNDLTISTGVKFRDKERHASFSDEFYTWDEDRGGETPTLDQFSLSDQPGKDDFLNELTMDYTGDLGQVADVEAMKDFWNKNKDNFDLDEAESALISNGKAIGRNFDLREQHTGIYWMADATLTDQLSMNAGLRLEHTKTELKGYKYEQVGGADSDGVVSVVRDTTAYLSWLPSLHLKYALDDLQNVRLALTRSFARPDFGDIQPGSSYSEHDEELFEGNPELNPTYSNNLDLIYSRYFDEVGIISAGIFYKYIQDPIFQQTSTIDYRGGSVKHNKPVNGFNSWLAGAEFTVDHRFGFISPALSDFGARFNYTFTDSKMTFAERDSAAVPRQADHLANLMFYYDNSTFAARIAMNYKDEYIMEHGSDANSDTFYGDYMSLDFSAQYNVTDSMLVYFEANNLNNEPMKFYTGSEKRPDQVEYYGPRFQLGVSYDVF